MDQTLSLVAPFCLLFVVVAGYLVTVFEPYFAHRSQEGQELISYHAGDLKLKLIARWWAAKLLSHPGGRYEAEHENALFEGLHKALVRHRFIYGDDPGRLRYRLNGTSLLLSRVLRTLPQVPANRDIQVVMEIIPNRVEIKGERVIWEGMAPEYRSRFCDMYNDYDMPA